MRGDTEDAGTCLLRAGWRQGAVLEADGVARLGHADHDCALVLSQDCDVVQAEAVEPDVELILGRRAPTARPDCQFGRHPRRLDLPLVGHNGCVALEIRDRIVVPKQALAKLQPSVTLELDPTAVRMLANWVARRYTRPAWPDAFNQRLVAINDDLDRLCKGHASRLISGIWLDLAPPAAELTAGENYKVSVWLTVEPETRSDAARDAEARDFEARFGAALSKCPGIEVLEVELRDERDFSLNDLRHFRRLDRDYRSVAPKPGGAKAPPET
jgi:hypothetical protein